MYKLVDFAWNKNYGYETEIKTINRKKFPVYKRDSNGHKISIPYRSNTGVLDDFKLKASNYNIDKNKHNKQYKKNKLTYNKDELIRSIENKVSHLKNKAEKRYTTEPGSISRSEYRLKTGIRLKPGEKSPAIRDEEAIKKAHEGIEAAGNARKDQVNSIYRNLVDTADSVPTKNININHKTNSKNKNKRKGKWIQVKLP